MVETELALLEAKDTTFNASGEARLRFGPTGRSERWEVEIYSVSVDSGTTRAWVFRNTESSPPLDFTQQGSGDASTLGTVRLRQGEELIFKWADGVSGVRAQARVEGKKFIPGQRAY